MVNISINVNKTNSHISSHRIGGKTITIYRYGFGNPCLGLGQVQKCVGIKPVNVVLPLISVIRYDTNKQLKHEQIRILTISKMNDDINMDSTMAGSMNARA